MYEPIDKKKKEAGKELKEYLHIVTDFLPYTINDLDVNPSAYQGCDLEQSINFC